MLDEVWELYQQVILDHNQHPHNFGELLEANHIAHGNNPLCGDEIAVFLHVEDGMIKKAHFSGNGCAIAKASASIMTDEVTGKSIEEAKHLFEQFHMMLTSEHPNEELGKLEVFSGVRQFPIRVKCATLAWHTLNAALKDSKDVVTTE